MNVDLTDRTFVLPLNSSNSIEFQSQLADRLQQNGASVSIYPQRKRYLKQTDNEILKRLSNIEYLNHEPANDLGMLLDKYSIESPRAFVFPQIVYDYEYLKPSGGRFLPNGPRSPNYKNYVSQLHKLLDYFNELYENGFEAIPVQNQGGEIIRRVLARVTDYYDIPSVRCSFNPIAGRMTVRDGEEMNLEEVGSALEKTLTKKEEERAEEYRLTVINDRPQVGSELNRSQRDSLRSNILGKIQTVLEKRTESLPLIYRWLRTNMGGPVQAKAQQFYSLDKFDTHSHIQDTEYAFYSIQYFRESRVTMRAPAFYDQASLIEFLSRSVPHNTELLVKDHPQQLGAMPFFDIRRISRYATLADPSFSAHDIIENASVVVTLNNTVGHEAIVFGKPVVALGSALYSDLDGVVSPSDINNLDSAISKAINEGGLSDNEVRQYIDALYRISEPIVWGDPSPENISNFVSAIRNHLDNTD